MFQCVPCRLQEKCFSYNIFFLSTKNISIEVQTNKWKQFCNQLKLRYLHTTMCCLNNLDYPWYIHYFNPINIITLSYKFINADKAVDKNKKTKFISRPGHIEVNSSTSCTGKLLEFVFVQRIYQKIFLDHKTYCNL